MKRYRKSGEYPLKDHLRERVSCKKCLKLRQVARHRTRDFQCLWKLETDEGNLKLRLY